jgi:hypothetical protein
MYNADSHLARMAASARNNCQQNGTNCTAAVIWSLHAAFKTGGVSCMSANHIPPEAIPQTAMMSSGHAQSSAEAISQIRICDGEMASWRERKNASRGHLLNQLEMSKINEKE